MPDSVPVSPAAQAVDGGPPDLWWSPGLAADTFDAQDGVVTEDRGQLYRQQNATWRYIESLPADAVRLVPAPGPDVRLRTAIADEAVNAYEAAQGGDDPTSVLRRVIGNLERLAGTPVLLDRIYGPDGESRRGDCTCEPGSEDFEFQNGKTDICLDANDCDACALLPADHPCWADIVTQGEAGAAGVRTDGETPQ